METIVDYFKEIEYASYVLIDAIWEDNKEAEKLKLEIERESKIVGTDYNRLKQFNNSLKIRMI